MKKILASLITSLYRKVRPASQLPEPSNRTPNTQPVPEEVAGAAPEGVAAVTADDGNSVVPVHAENVTVVTSREEEDETPDDGVPEPAAAPAQQTNESNEESGADWLWSGVKQSLPWGIAGALLLILLFSPFEVKEQEEVTGEAPNATAATSVAKSFVTPPAIKSLARSNFAGNDWKDITFPAEVTKDQCARVELPMGLNIRWEPQAPVTYRVKTSHNEDKEFPAVTQAEIKMETPLFPWFEICAEEPLTLNITAERPKRSS